MSFILETTSKFILEIIQASGYLGIFFLMTLESVNIPIPSEIIMPFSGFLVATGAFGFWLVVLAGALGNLFGSLISYGLGYLTRQRIFSLWKNQRRTNFEIQRAQRWLERFGDGAVFLSRLLPIVRTFISFPIGIIGTISLKRFSVLTFLGSFIWSGILTGLGLFLGENWEILGFYFRKFDYIILILILAGVAWWFKKYFNDSRELANNKNIGD